jgi:hypothetical protein
VIDTDSDSHTEPDPENNDYKPRFTGGPTSLGLAKATPFGRIGTHVCARDVYNARYRIQSILIYTSVCRCMQFQLRVDESLGMQYV